MKIERIERSMEECQQAGWQGWDIYFDSPITKEQILLWQTLGDLLYLPQLRQPFFRIAGKDFLIKGLEGQKKLRIGMQTGFLNMASVESVSRFFLCE